MKKNIERIIGILIASIICYQHFSYADVYVPERVFFNDVPFPIIIAFVYFMVVFAILFFDMKISIKMAKTKNNDEELLARKQKKLNIYGTILYIFINTIFICICIFVLQYDYKVYFGKILLFPIIVLYCSSFATRMRKNRKASNILCMIAIFLMIIMWGSFPLSKARIDNYNAKFINYIENYDAYITSPRYTTDVEGLINTIINHNKYSRKKVSITYDEKEYVSSDELRQLLEGLDKERFYKVETQYDENSEYIEKFSLTSSLDVVLNICKKYDGVNRKGIDVDILVNQLETMVYFYWKDINTNIVFSSEMGQETIRINGEDRKENMKSLSGKIDESKTYDVKIQTNSIDTCDVIITEKMN